MKYPQLNSLVPATEHFDESAINEGVYLSIAHIDSIEQTLAGSSTLQAGLDETIATHAATIASLTGEKETAEKELTVNATRIKELQDQVAALSGESSGKGTVISTKADEQNNEDKEVPSWMDDSNPSNQFADKRLKKK